MPGNGTGFAAWWWWLGVLALGISGAWGAGPRAAGPFTIDVWTTDEGLPHDTVTSIIKSHDGYLWFGTVDGLVRWAGATNYVVFDESNTPGLGNSWIVHLFEDRTGGLWVGTQTAGVVLIKDGRVTSEGIGQGSSEQRLAAACEDANGAVWLYTADGQLWRFFNGRFNVFTDAAIRRSIRSRTLIAEPSGTVWVGTDLRQYAIGSSPDPGSLALPIAQTIPTPGLDLLLASARGGYWRLAGSRVKKCSDKGEEVDLGGYQWDSRTNVTSACEDVQGSIWVGTRGAGLFRFERDAKVSHLTTEQGLSSDVILTLYADSDGSVWVGTDGGGLDRIKPRVFQVPQVLGGSTEVAAQSVCEDANGGLWIGFNGAGAVYWKGGNSTRFDLSRGLPNLSVWSVHVDRQEQVWAGTWRDGLVRLQDGQFQREQDPGAPAAIHGNIHAIFQDQRGILWVGSQGGLARLEGQEWSLLTTSDGLSANDVQAIADDKEGNLWVGTAGGGLNRLRDGKFTAFHKSDGIPSENISSLYMDTDGVLWVGTLGGGLGRFEKGRWTRYTRGDGLSSNSIGYLVEDRQGYLWIGSSDGIMRVQKKDLTDFARKLTTYVRCRVYRKPDGLPTRECTMGSQPGGCLGQDGKVWLPTAKGVVYVDPSQLRSASTAPPVIIESVSIDGRELITNALLTVVPQSIVMRPGQERLDIRYTSIDLAGSDKGAFRYRLENHESQWTEAGNSRVAHYSALAPGHYRFHVETCNEEGVWDPIGRSLALFVQPPLWRTWWFLTALAICLLGAIVGTVHYVSTKKLQRQLAWMAQQEALEKERARIAQDIHDQVGASLTQVSLLGELVESDKDSPQEVEAHARQISRTARETTRALDEIVWAVNPSNDTLDGLVTYACKYAQEFLSVAGLRYRWEVPEQLPAVVLPPEFRHNVFLTFKEALTNVVRHASATAVWVRLQLEAGRFVWEIQDDGRGITHLDEKILRARNGLRGMRKRMEAIGGSFSFGAAPERGALARLTGPLPGQ